MAKYKLLNAVQCPLCERVIVSMHQHDYNLCGCPNKTMIDGGFAYDHYGGVKLPKRLTNLFIKLESK